MATDAHRPAVQLVALLTSAGGLNALATVLRDLPTDFPAAVVVQQHLGDHDSILPTVLRRQTARRVSWVHDGQALAPGQVVVCPPRKSLELTPDACCRLHDVKERGERRFDVLLASLATSHGPRSVGVVLSGSGRDGAAGTTAMKRAGAIVIAESADTAEYRSMPVAAARAGAALVLPIHQIGRVLADIVEGAPVPMLRGPSAQSDVDRAGTSAATRAEIARLRAVELRRRRQDLSAGYGSTAQTAAAARRRAEESRRRAQLAHQAAEEAAARREAEAQPPASPAINPLPP